MEVYFQYGETEIEYLKKADKRLAEVIEKVGIVKRIIIPDLFPALVNSIENMKKYEPQKRTSNGKRRND